jgi:hypothetical protein
MLATAAEWGSPGWVFGGLIQLIIVLVALWSHLETPRVFETKCYKS